ncbi:MAG TPA: hypothetical protein VMS38_15615 [Pseudorhodoferax sp.]|nr:hypothetical protein [Pseudorhodoferax sp.]
MTMGQFEPVREQRRHGGTPMARLGAAENVAEKVAMNAPSAALLLASNLSSPCTGAAAAR